MGLSAPFSVSRVPWEASTADSVVECFPDKRHLGIGEVGRVLLGRLALESQQRVRVAHRQRTQHDQVQEAEGGDVGADADGQHHDRGEREPRRAPQHPGGVAQVLAQPVDPRPAPRRPRVFAKAHGVAQPRAAGARRHLAMELEVVGQLLVEAAAVEEITKATEQLGHEGSFAYAVFRTDRMASLTRS